MADIYEPPEPAPRVQKQRVSEKKPFGTTIVTICAGFGGAMVGVLALFLGGFSPNAAIGMFYTVIGSINAVLGVLDIYVGISIWNHKYSTKNLGMLANIGLIVLNLLFFVIGIVGFVLCIISLITLLVLDTDTHSLV